MTLAVGTRIVFVPSVRATIRRGRPGEGSAIAVTHAVKGHRGWQVYGRWILDGGETYADFADVRSPDVASAIAGHEDRAAGVTSTPYYNSPAGMQDSHDEGLHAEAPRDGCPGCREGGGL